MIVSRPRHLTRVTLGSAAALLALSACGSIDKEAAAQNQAEVKSGAEAKATEIAWRHGDVEDAFAEAREQDKPVLLYWGAVWCPPCNRLKAGLFRNPDFIERTRDFIPVYLDGDSKGAQAWGERFNIQGYPTLIVLRPDRREITRLFSSGDTAQVEAVLDAVKRGGRDVEAIFKDALARPKQLSADDWTLLAGYGWSLDNGRLVQGGDTTGVLAKLAAAAPAAPLQRRFVLQSLASRKPDSPPLDAARRIEARRAVEAVLADPAELRSNRDTLIDRSGAILAAASAPGAERDQLAGKYAAVLKGFEAEAKLDAGDRLSLAGAELDLFRARAGDKAPLPQALVDKVKAQVARADRETTDRYARQSLISSAAHLLSDIGDRAGAEKLLKAELAKSASPYYYMPSLARLAEQRGDTAGAVAWLRRGYETSEGPASRVQWGVTYVEGLIRLDPGNKAAIEKAAGQVVGELAEQPAGYRQRTRQRLEGLGKSLAQWSAKHDGALVLAQLRSQTDKVCAKQADKVASAACRGWLARA
ncbi:thioredoxin family protein [Sphingomonas sp.]|uniref:thioredoxin family protein n=1 Tax=Sphingomonas sp. TaxID=28214 RepID=UPI0031DA0490